MELSRHNIIGELKDNAGYYIVNLLSGEADILEEKAYRELLAPSPGSSVFRDKGYWVDPEAESRLFQEKYLDFIEQRDSDELQIFFVTNYACNFDCPYCYQSGYEHEKQRLTRKVIDTFFSFVNQKFGERKKYITLFGGEPLLNGTNHKELIRYFFQQAASNSLEVAVVSNGYHVLDYLDIFKLAKIREVQVTLDGLKDVHDQRRFLQGGGHTFDRIVKGIDALLEHQMPVNLRMVIDNDNIDELPRLADFAIEKGWTSQPWFKTQLGRNYELHECQTNQDKLFSRLAMHGKLYELIKTHPSILEFHRPAFSISRFLFENGELPSPLFDACTGAKTEWAFDFTGKIYSCTATVGKAGEELGTFFPEVVSKSDEIENWEDRDILSIQACKTCNLALACGGGCASVAKNKHGSLHEPDCRPVTELLSLGISSYLEA